MSFSYDFTDVFTVPPTDWLGFAFFISLWVMLQIWVSQCQSCFRILFLPNLLLSLHALWAILFTYF